MSSLLDIYVKYMNHASWGDKGTVHSYIEVYEAILAPWRTTAKRVLEIGIHNGSSLRMWEEYFDKSEVHGIDANDQPLAMADLRPMIAEGTHHISLLDASNQAQVEARFAGMMFDVIIEDASHELHQQMEIYKCFKSHVAPGGIYIIEDVENIDKDRAVFENIDSTKTVQIIDRRGVKGRFDDVLVIIT